MMKNSKLKFSEYMQNISSSKSFGKFVQIAECSSRWNLQDSLKIRVTSSIKILGRFSCVLALICYGSSCIFTIRNWKLRIIFNQDVSVEYAKHPTKHFCTRTTGCSNSDLKKRTEIVQICIDFLQQYFTNGQ